jgi:hypothetical protein
MSKKKKKRGRKKRRKKKEKRRECKNKHENTAMQMSMRDDPKTQHIQESFAGLLRKVASKY